MNLYCMKRLCVTNIHPERLNCFRNYWKYKDIEAVISLSKKNIPTIQKIFPDIPTLTYNDFDIYKNQNSINNLFTFIGNQKKVNLTLIGDNKNIQYICYQDFNENRKLSTFSPILLELTFNKNFCDN